MTDKIIIKGKKETKREYFTNGDITTLKISSSYGVFETIFDTKNVNIVKNRKWNIKPNKGSWYVYCYDKTVPSKYLPLHRLIAKTPQGLVTDHINRNTLDNRECNLRVCTIQENNKNRRVYKTNKYGTNGVYFDKKMNSYIAHIRIKDEHIYIGAYDTVQEAVIARKDYELDLIKKDLSRKTEECERLRNIKDDYFYQLEIAHEAIQDKNNIIEKIENELQAEKQKVEELKQWQEDAENILKTQLDNFDKRERRYQQALEDIKSYCSEQSDEYYKNCKYAKSCVNACGIDREVFLKQILQKCEVLKDE